MSVSNEPQMQLGIDDVAGIYLKMQIIHKVSRFVNLRQILYFTTRNYNYPSNISCTL